MRVAAVVALLLAALCVASAARVPDDDLSNIKETLSNVGSVQRWLGLAKKEKGDEPAYVAFKYYVEPKDKKVRQRLALQRICVARVVVLAAGGTHVGPSLGRVPGTSHTMKRRGNSRLQQVSGVLLLPTWHLAARIRTTAASLPGTKWCPDACVHMVCAKLPAALGRATRCTHSCSCC
ncbi:hypothetical protein COO60DRAFT_445642 [Scenedesmus sp. NREL 46B-D3]|nr:hypothetical protein COO60DRAFT_445642 [Scenedesmus sp. NREL 46B-D3]